MGSILKSAVISECGTYRYMLTRTWGPSSWNRVCFVMLNPSTADATDDDPTIRRCIGFAQRWGYDSLSVVNQYAYRATHPLELTEVSDPIGPENSRWLEEALYRSTRVICAWGARGSRRQDQEIKMIAKRYARNLYSLGLTKNQKPLHPLYLKNSTRPSIWWVWKDG